MFILNNDEARDLLERRVRFWTKDEDAVARDIRPSQ